jgi:hypothetical protein
LADLKEHLEMIRRQDAVDLTPPSPSSPSRSAAVARQLRQKKATIATLNQLLGKPKSDLAAKIVAKDKDVNTRYAAVQSQQESYPPEVNMVIERLHNENYYFKQ